GRSSPRERVWHDALDDSSRGLLDDFERIPERRLCPSTEPDEIWRAARCEAHRLFDNEGHGSCLPLDRLGGLADTTTVSLNHPACELVGQGREHLGRCQRPVDGDDSPRRHAADCRRELLEPKLYAQFRNEHEKTIEIIRRIFGADFGRWKRLPVGLTYVKDGDGFDSSGCGRVDLLLAPSIRAHASGHDDDPLLP